MSTKARTQPHDALFKAAFTDPEHAAGHLRSLLDPAIAARIDFASLEVVPGSFVDEDLRLRHTDLLYRVRVGRKKALLYVLHEHQSTVDVLMVLRLLTYMRRIWDDHLAKHPKAKTIPAIIPVVVYHGEARWYAATSFAELFDLDDDDRTALAPYLPSFRFVLDDLSLASDASIRGRKMSAFGRIVLWALKHARERGRILEDLAPWADLIKEMLRARNGQAAFELLLRYILEVRPDVALDELPALVATSFGPDAEEATMNALERWLEENTREARRQAREEARKEALAEGQREGQREMLSKLLVAKFGALPDTAAARVRNASATELEVWMLRVLTATSLAEVFAEPRAKPRARR
ncbi:MAG: Rpn family recombination-promoting nuclease/putative transposase [Minicystis sp.]